MQEHGSLTDPAYAQALEVLLPLAHRLPEGPRIVGEVRIPLCGVVEWVRALRREDPGGAAGRLHPGHDAFVGRVLVLGQPADEQRRKAILREMIAGRFDDAGRDFVFLEPAIAISPTTLG